MAARQQAEQLIADEHLVLASMFPDADDIDLRDSGEIRLRLSQAEDAWLVLTPDPGYPIGQPLRVAVSGDFPARTKNALEAAGQAVALDYALANEVAAHATFSAPDWSI